MTAPDVAHLPPVELGQRPTEGKDRAEGVAFVHLRSSTFTPLFASSASIACSDRGRMAVLVRVNRIAVGIAFPAVFSMFRTRLYRLYGLDSVERAALGRDDDKVGAADRVADHQADAVPSRSTMTKADVARRLLDLVDDRVLGHVGDDA